MAEKAVVHLLAVQPALHLLAVHLDSAISSPW